MSNSKKYKSMTSGKIHPQYVELKTFRFRFHGKWALKHICGFLIHSSASQCTYILRTYLPFHLFPAAVQPTFCSIYFLLGGAQTRPTTRLTVRCCYLCTAPPQTSGARAWNSSHNSKLKPGWPLITEIFKGSLLEKLGSIKSPTAAVLGWTVAPLLCTEIETSNKTWKLIIFHI